jgi:predicted DNA-binding transcriptional regulator AlpA
LTRERAIEHDRRAMADGIPMATRSELDGVRAKIEPRGLSRVEAATYVGVSPSLFDEMVKDRRMPKPKRINSRTVWDRKKLDEAFEALPDDGDSDGNPWDQVAA